MGGIKVEHPKILNHSVNISLQVIYSQILGNNIVFKLLIFPSFDQYNRKNLSKVQNRKKSFGLPS